MKIKIEEFIEMLKLFNTSIVNGGNVTCDHILCGDCPIYVNGICDKLCDISKELNGG